MVRTTLRIVGLFMLVVWGWSQSAFAQSAKLEVLKVDTSDFPNIRVYVDVPEPDWAKGSASIEFTEKADPEAVALAKARKSKKSPLAVPEDKLSGALHGFGKQVDPNEQLLVVFVLDASGSTKSAVAHSHRHERVAVKIARGVTCSDF